MRTKVAIYILITVSSIVLAACFGSRIYVYKSEKTLSVNGSNPYTDYWSALYCGMPEMTEQYIAYDEQMSLTKAFKYIKNGNYDSAEVLLWTLQKSSNDTIATAGKKLLNSILFYNSKWSACDSLYKQSGKAKLKKAIPLYLDYAILPRENYSFSQEADTIKIEIQKGLPILPITIKGKVYRFLIDTGCDITCLRESVAMELNLKLLNIHSNGVINSIGDYFNVASSAMDSLKVGKTTAYNHPIIVTGDNNLTFELMNHTFIEFYGIIGWNFLKNLDFILDYKKEVLIIRKPIYRPEAENNMFWMSTPILKLYSSDGIEMNFAFDTGDQSSNFFELLLKKIRPENIETDLRLAYGVGSSKIVEIKRLRTLELFLPHYKIEFYNYESGVELEGLVVYLDGRLGSDLMEYSKIRIDALNNNYEYYRYSVSDY